ncbi:hypothetical protein CK203_092647 [Vitis vinifera]|uniref:Uncharacterized protein n=1 Tax=Vitis vinifera TaxID=29760 RepID=A0A438BUW6_VITVI|nr:hypothetical protein CK203_092647 [Vitis vinifera]
MIPGGRNFKEIERKKIGSKSEQNRAKQRKNRALRISQLRKEFGTRVPLRSTGASLQLRNALRSGKPDFAQKSHSAGYFAIAKVILAHECHFAAQLFISFLETHHASLRSSSSISSSGQISATRNGANRGAKYSSPSNRKRSLRKEPVLDPFLSLRSRTILLRASPVPSPSPLPVSSPVPSPAPQTKPQEPQPPLPKPQIPAEIAPEEVIRRPMLTQPPIEGNLDCRARPFHSELFFDIAAFRVRPELTQSFNLLRRYHMEHLLTPRDFFYPRIAMDFYQSMTTNQVRDPTLFISLLMGGMAYWEHAILLKPCKFPMSQPNSIILELGPILLAGDGAHPFQRSCQSITFVEGGASSNYVFD